MGTGKTFIATAAAHMAGFHRVLVLCPPHLTRKWKREVEETVPSVRTAIVTSITDLERLRYSVGARPPLRRHVQGEGQAVLPLEAGSHTEVGRGQRQASAGRGDGREPFRIPCCPVCNTQILDKDGVPLTYNDLKPQEAGLSPLQLSPLAGRR